MVAPAPVEERALEHALRLLDRRPLSREALQRRLCEAGFAAGVVQGALERLERVGLVDDASLAVALVEREIRKGRGDAAILAALEAAGIDPVTAARALEAAGADEEQRARSVAADLVGRRTHESSARQAARLHAALLRRGFGEEAAEAAVRAVLPSEGWD